MKHLLIIALLAATAQAQDITIAVTIRDAASTNRETAQINNTNTAAKVIAFWQSLGTNTAGRNAALEFKSDAIERAKDAYVRGETEKARDEVQAKVEAAQRDAAKWGKE